MQEDEDESVDARRLWLTLPQTMKTAHELRQRRQQRLQDILSFAAVSEDPSVRALASSYEELGLLISMLESEKP